MASRQYALEQTSEFKGADDDGVSCTRPQSDADRLKLLDTIRVRARCVSARYAMHARY